MDLPLYKTKKLRFAWLPELSPIIFAAYYPLPMPTRLAIVNPISCWNLGHQNFKITSTMVKTRMPRSPLPFTGFLHRASPRGRPPGPGSGGHFCGAAGHETSERAGAMRFAVDGDDRWGRWWPPVGTTTVRTVVGWWLMLDVTSDGWWWLLMIIDACNLLNFMMIRFTVGVNH